MSDDPQDTAEDFDEDVVGRDDGVLSEEADPDFPPEEPVGLPFADADVTDESFAEREAQEEPEVWQPRLVTDEDDDADVAAEEQLGTIIELPDRSE
jgi:hypothetical protein